MNIYIKKTFRAGGGGGGGVGLGVCQPLPLVRPRVNFFSGLKENCTYFASRFFKNQKVREGR